MKKGDNLGLEDISHLNQLIDSLLEAEEKLEMSYRKEDYGNFIKSKKLILNIQKEILEVIR